jgi:hypothetical protein
MTVTVDPWAAYTAPTDEPTRQPAREVSRLGWMEAMTEAVSAGRLEAATVAYGLMFSRGGFDYETGEQTQAKTYGYLAATSAHSASTWKRQVQRLRDAGWLVPSGRTAVFNGQATPLYRLAVPAVGE